MKRPQTSTLLNAAAVFLACCVSAHNTFAFSTDTAAKTVTSDGSFEDTSAALAAVANKKEDGWTLTVGSPNGTYTWPSMLTINVPYVFTIQGASASARPTITVTATTGFGLYVECKHEKPVTIKDMRFEGWKTANGLFMLGGGGEDTFRFTNIEFTGANTAAIWISSPGGVSGMGGPYGVIDNCTLPNGGGLIYVRDNPGARPDSWHRPMSWGTKKAVYVEDCTMSASTPRFGIWGVGDGDHGGRVVIRHCKLRNMPMGTHGADSQPLINGQNPNQSVLQVEIMHNEITVTDALDTFFFLRGGTATVFDNTVNKEGGGFLNTFIKTAFYRATPGNGVCPVDRYYPADYVGTQQPGSGVVDSPGQDPKMPNEPWGSVPIYSWNNRLNLPVVWGEVGGNSFTLPDRDYFVGKPRPGYTEYTYPHPLRAEGTRPSPPTNLRVTP